MCVRVCVYLYMYMFCDYMYCTDFAHLTSYMPGLTDFPMVPIHVTDE